MLHLLHPLCVHFSVALLSLGSLVEAAGLLGGREGAARFGGLLALIGTATLPLTILSGYLAAGSVELRPSAQRLLSAHERNGWLVLGVFAAGLLWKAWNRGVLPGGQQRAYAVLLLAGVALVAYGAWLGAELVYGHGVGVAAGR
jgi:uncharacterized membrane protein